MKHVLSAENPAALLQHIQTHGGQSGLYFLDIDLHSDINGIELAAKIKKLDISATIVFITTHSEMMHYVFRLKIEAMEYILKDSPPQEVEQRVVDCMQMAYQRFLGGKHSSGKYFTAKIGGRQRNIPYDDIMFFESSTERRNKIILHKANSIIDFYGTIADVSGLGPPFYECHQSFVVNINYVKQVDTRTREIEMTDGTIVPVARRKMTEFMANVDLRTSR